MLCHCRTLNIIIIDSTHNKSLNISPTCYTLFIIGQIECRMMEICTAFTVAIGFDMDQKLLNDAVWIYTKCSIKVVFGDI